MKASFLILPLTLLLIGCSSNQNQTPGQEQAKSGKQQDQKQESGTTQQVKVSKVESAMLDTTIALPAQITPYESVDVYSKVTGFVKSIRVDRGTRVRAGEPIIRLSAPEMLAQRAQADAVLRAAEAQVAAVEAKLAADRGTYMHLAAAAKTPGVVAGNDLQIAEQAAVSDQAQVEAAKHSVSAARDTLRSASQLESYLDVRAPFSGVVTARYLHPGALVGPNSGQSGAQPIVQIQDMDRLRLVVPVPEEYVADVRDGGQVEFTVSAYPGQTFHAPIARIAHSVNQQTRTMAVELDVPNKDAHLTPGVFASVHWPVRHTHPTLFVPSSAITTDLQRTFVVRVRNNKAEWIDVQSGVVVNGKTEVFGDLKSGDEVVTNPTDAIRPGTPVTAQGDHSESALIR